MPQGYGSGMAEPLSKVANVLIEDARGRPLGLRIGAVLALFRRAYGGLWVGGRVTLDDEVLVFTPNAVNRAVNEGTLDVRVALADVEAVEVRFGVVTKVVAVTTPARTLKLRCYGARRFAEEIARRCPRAVTVG